MVLTEEITDFEVKNSGKQFDDKMYFVSAKLILKEGEIVIYEGVFSEKHKHIYTIANTMDKIAIKMVAAKKKIEIEIALKIEAEAEKTNMLDKIASIKGVE